MIQQYEDSLQSLITTYHCIDDLDPTLTFAWVGVWDLTTSQSQLIPAQSCVVKKFVQHPRTKSIASTLYTNDIAIVSLGECSTLSANVSAAPLSPANPLGYYINYYNIPSTTTAAPSTTTSSSTTTATTSAPTTTVPLPSSESIADPVCLPTPITYTSSYSTSSGYPSTSYSTGYPSSYPGAIVTMKECLVIGWRLSNDQTQSYQTPNYAVPYNMYQTISASTTVTPQPKILQVARVNILPIQDCYDSALFKNNHLNLDKLQSNYICISYQNAGCIDDPGAALVCPFTNEPTYSSVPGYSAYIPPTAYRYVRSARNESSNITHSPIIDKLFPTQIELTDNLIDSSNNTKRSERSYMGYNAYQSYGQGYSPYSQGGGYYDDSVYMGGYENNHPAYDSYTAESYATYPNTYGANYGSYAGPTNYVPTWDLPSADDYVPSNTGISYDSSQLNSNYDPNSYLNSGSYARPATPSSSGDAYSTKLEESSRFQIIGIAAEPPRITSTGYCDFKYPVLYTSIAAQHDFVATASELYVNINPDADPCSTSTTTNPSTTSSSTGPTTSGPTTVGPTTVGPTTVGPTTVPPTTVGPTTIGSTTTVMAP
jgi:hypothetical protein